MIFPNFLFQKGIKSKRLNTHHFITILLQYNLIVPMHIYGQFTILAYLKGEKKKLNYKAIFSGLLVSLIIMLQLRI